MSLGPFAKVKAPPKWGRLESGNRLRVRLDVADVELVDQTFDGKKKTRCMLTAPDPVSGEAKRWSFPHSVFDKLKEVERRGKVDCVIKKTGEGITTRYQVFTLKTHEQKIVHELIELAQRYEDEDK